jgi:glucose/arabinose dehydrogenase/mono/diheme cytochrome c family protein
MNFRWLAFTCVGWFTLTVRAALPLPEADDGGLALPPGFRALVVADRVGRDPDGKGFGSLRFLTVTPNGDVFVKGSADGIYALRDADGDGRAEERRRFGHGNGTGIAWRDGWLYFSTTTEVRRYRLAPGELVPSGEPETIVTGLPVQRSHDAKSFAFDGAGRLLVEVGSPYNVYSKPDRQFGAKGMDATEFQKTYGGFWRFDASKTNQTQADGFHFSTGHRHSLALAWNPVATNFFMVMMGRDNLNIVDPAHYDELDNAERVAEEMHLLREGVNLGWPYTYWDPIKNARMVCPEFGGDNRTRSTNTLYDPPLIAFPAHWAPLQMARYDGGQFPERYRGGMFIAFHGSWNRAPRSQAGYKIGFVPFDEHGLPRGGYETFADGFAGRDEFVNTRDARYRPSGVAVGPDGSLYVCETERGRVWRIFYTGETNAVRVKKTSAAAAAPSAVLLGNATPGGKIYAQACAACHMANASGVPGLQPALAGSQVVVGDTARLIRVVLRGPAAVLPAEREKFGNVMPAFGSVLGDADVADVLNYLRRNFAPDAGTVTAAQVAAERASAP